LMVLVLGALGCTRRVEAGPPMAPSAGPYIADVDFKADEPDVTLYLKKVYPGEDPEDSPAPFRKVCTGSCQRQLPMGHYQVALGTDDDQPVAGEVLEIDGPTSFEGEYRDRMWLRIAGIATTVVGPVAGVAMMGVSERSCKYEGEGYDYSDRECSTSYPLLAPGFLVFAGSIASGIVMMTRRDKAEFSVSPGVAQASQSAEPAALSDGLKGLTVSGSF